jgi:hypothetical protein
LEAVFKGLLVLQDTNLVPGYVSPIIDWSASPPHVSCPKGKELEAGHRQLGDLVAHGCPSRLLDGMAGLLDGVIIKFSKGIKRSDHLVVLEGI